MESFLLRIENLCSLFIISVIVQSLVFSLLVLDKPKDNS
jgi:hypothetical protein